MTVATTNIEKLKKLRTFAATLTGACERWGSAYADTKHYDKQGFGFSYRGELGAFTVPSITLEAYVGTYGNSSVSTALRVDSDLAKTYFASALNQHKQAIFDSMAALASKDADALRDAAAREIEALRELLGEAEADPALMVEAA